MKQHFNPNFFDIHKLNILSPCGHGGYETRTFQVSKIKLQKNNKS